MSETQGPGPSPEELSALQAAEEAKADPTLDEVEPASIDVAEGAPEKEEPFEKLAAQARRMTPERARAVVEALLERRLLKILGKKEEPGRPILYGTTREFLEFFALKDLASLPTLREFHELSEEHREIVEKQPEPPIAGLVDELADDALRATLETRRAEGDAALEELERAIDAADRTSRSAERALEDKDEGNEGGPPPGEG